ncbi:olfactory receptor 52E4-like [Hypomesus transpacificus]|uniref:olfactory receptor 52E4-like n=1 Tax=Hypomesus transpacificus TaxID=137520 RepID=UPI001F08140C|nr:olfactory receptor 52E4-like [Hypomesus transpacificus]
MYIFLCNLCINALYGTAGFYPRFLSDLLSDDQVISYGGCVTQGFVIYTSVMCEITLLTAMAYDRYVAICKPLQYHTLLTPATVGKIIVLAWCYPLLISGIAVLLTVRLPLCGSRICKLFCDNGSILQHSCAPVTINRIWSAFTLAGQILQVILIGWSYLQITRVCLRSEEGRLKFTQTCVPHLLTMVIFIVVTLFDVLNSFYGDQNMPLNLRNLMALQFLIVPPVFNPVIYGLNLQKVRTAVFIRKNKIRY